MALVPRARHPQTVSPAIDVLPDDILVYIFELGMTAARRSATRTKKPFHFALSISHVCARWRTLAIDLSLLWSHIQIRDDVAEQARAKLCLPRTKTAPIELDVQVDWANIAGAAKVLRTHLPHVRRLCLRGDPDEMGALLAACDGRALMLEDLQLHALPGHSQKFNRHRLDISGLFGGRPLTLLKHVDLCLLNLQWPTNLLRGLRTITLRQSPFGDCPTFDEFVSSLEASPELEELHLRCPLGIGFLPGSPFSPRAALAPPKGIAPRPSVLNRLRVITFEHAFVDALSTILPLIDSPTLHEIRLIAEECHYQTGLDLPSRARALDSVERLTIHGMAFNYGTAAAALLDLVKRAHHVRNLSLDHGAGVGLLHDLSAPHNRAVLPELEHVEVAGCRALTNRACVSFVRARNASACERKTSSSYSPIRGMAFKDWRRKGRGRLAELKDYGVTVQWT